MRLSVRIYDDLNIIYDKRFRFNKMEELENVLKIIYDDPSFHDRYFKSETRFYEIIKDLHNQGYSVFNRHEKYYVYAFSIDFTTFYIWSKDCDAEIIDWGDKRKGCFYNNFEDDYDVNPIIKLLSKFQNVDK